MTSGVSLYIVCKNISFLLEFKVPNFFLKTNSNLCYHLKTFQVVIISLAFLFLLKFKPEKEGEVNKRQKDG